MMNQTVGESKDETQGQQLSVQDWGVVDYAKALKRQEELVELVHQGLVPETIVFCAHKPVVTLGRGTREGDVFAWKGPMIEVTRGGRATYHGPNQIVAYPILNLNNRGRDLHKYLRDLETAIVCTLADYGIESAGRSMQIEDGNSEATEATGVWIGNRKIASLGIGVRKWVSFHGLALNVSHDPHAFQGMKPCGFTTETMTNLEELLGRPVDRVEVQERLLQHLFEVLVV